MKLGFDLALVEYAVTEQPGDDRPPDHIIFAQPDAAHNGDPVPLDGRVILLQIPVILCINPVQAAD